MLMHDAWWRQDSRMHATGQHDTQHSGLYMYYKMISKFIWSWIFFRVRLKCMYSLSGHIDVFNKLSYNIIILPN